MNNTEVLQTQTYKTNELTHTKLHKHMMIINDFKTRKTRIRLVVFFCSTFVSTNMQALVVMSTCKVIIA